MKTYLFKVFYLGEGFSGFQRQPDANTVEKEIEQTLIRLGYITSFEQNKYRSASRTDKNVNALGNIFKCSFASPPNLYEINHAMNHRIQLWAFAEVAEDYQLRPLAAKTYSYQLLNQKPTVIDNFQRIHAYSGVHDFKNFIKNDRIPRVTICNITNIEYQVNDLDIYVEITGDHFGWNQIRRMLGFLTDERYLNISVEEVLEADENVYSIRNLPGYFLTLKEVFLRENVTWEEISLKPPIEDLVDKLTTQSVLIKAQLNFLQEYLTRK